MDLHQENSTVYEHSLISCNNTPATPYLGEIKLDFGGGDDEHRWKCFGCPSGRPSQVSNQAPANQVNMMCEYPSSGTRRTGSRRSGQPKPPSKPSVSDMCKPGGCGMKLMTTMFEMNKLMGNYSDNELEKEQRMIEAQCYKNGNRYCGEYIETGPPPWDQLVSDCGAPEDPWIGSMPSGDTCSATCKPTWGGLVTNWDCCTKMMMEATPQEFQTYMTAQASACNTTLPGACSGGQPIQFVVEIDNLNYDWLDADPANKKLVDDLVASEISQELGVNKRFVTTTAVKMANNGTELTVNLEFTNADDSDELMKVLETAYDTRRAFSAKVSLDSLEKLPATARVNPENKVGGAVKTGSVAVGSNTKNVIITVSCISNSSSGGQGNASCTCKAGFSGTDGNICRACIAGKYKDVSGSGACTNCAAGKYGTSAGMTSCALCIAGKFKNATGSGACIDCAAGKSAATAGATVCTTTPTTTIVADKNTKHFVVITVTMPYSRAEFDQAKQNKYKEAVAKAAGTVAANIELKITDARRRASSIKVETKIRASSADGVKSLKSALGSGDALKNKINKELEAQGLAKSTGVSEGVSETGGGGLSSGAIAGIVVGTLAGVGILVRGVKQYHQHARVHASSRLQKYALKCAPNPGCRGVAIQQAHEER